LNEQHKERWAKLRAKGAKRFMLRGVTAAVLCVAAGQVIWWALMFAWRGESVPYFVREPGSSVAMAVGFLSAGYLQASREWRKNEREFLATAGADADRPAVSRAGAS
jgi:hypothetical protein